MARVKNNFIQVHYPEPHSNRTKVLLSEHPELKSLFGNTPSTAGYIFVIVLLQIIVAFLISPISIPLILISAFTIGAVADHALWTLIHESTHNLVFRKSRNNILLQLIANLPIILPVAISFRYYHLFHHRYQGQPDRDADLPSDFEAKIVGNTALGKSMWLCFFPVFQALRVKNLQGIRRFDGWILMNLILQLAFCITVVQFAGLNALLYLSLSSLFSIGPHPLGARWIQEHFVLYPNQETYSYYGPLNLVAFNVGFHNEHHDLVCVPWSRLPLVKSIAPEFYSRLHYHKSWTRLLFRFLFDPSISLHSRVIRTRRNIEIK